MELVDWGELPPSRGRCKLLGENCFPPQGEGEQWPVYGWEIDLDCLAIYWVDCGISYIVISYIIIIIGLAVKEAVTFR